MTMNNWNKTIGIYIALIVVCTCSFICRGAQQQHLPTAQEQKSLSSFLRDYFSRPRWDKSTNYSAAFVDLKGDGKKEVVVYVKGQSMCGSGGCITLILAPTSSSYKVISYMTITWPPIRILASKTNGWHDIGVWVEGGGIQPGYEAKLSFNGKKYPRNPSVPPAKRLSRDVAGKVVIAQDSEGTYLYQ